MRHEHDAPDAAGLSVGLVLYLTWKMVGETMLRMEEKSFASLMLVEEESLNAAFMNQLASKVRAVRERKNQLEETAARVLGALSALNGKLPEGAERERLVREQMHRFRLEGLEKAYPAQLSGGMKQRVSIARAYANDPDILLMDEPFGALDAQTRYAMEQELRTIWEKERRTVLFVTNNIEEAIYLGDRVVVMSALPGRVKTEYAIDIPAPRNYTDPAFLALRKKVSDDTELVL